MSLLEDVAKKAEVGKGTLYEYFKNKEELIAELYLSAKFKLSQHLSESLATADDLAGHKSVCLDYEIVVLQTAG